MPWNLARFPQIARDLAMVYAETGKLDQALDELDQAKGVTDDGRDLDSARAYAYARNGHAGRPWAVGQTRTTGRSQAAAYSIAAVYSALGDKDRAFAWLDRAFSRTLGREGRNRGRSALRRTAQRSTIQGAHKAVNNSSDGRTPVCDCIFQSHNEWSP